MLSGVSAGVQRGGVAAGSSPVADPVKELLRRESGRVASCGEAVEDLQRLEEGLLEVLTRREADLEAVAQPQADAAFPAPPLLCDHSPMGDDGGLCDTRVV